MTMKIGIGVGGRTIKDAVAAVQQAEADGFTSAWFSNIFGLDAMTACAAAGLQTQRIELGTFVVPTYPRHPHAMAQQAMSTNDACGGRFTLGIGLSHQIVIETMFGLEYAKPARHMEEYLTVLLGLMKDGQVAFDGEQYRVHGQLERGGPTPQVVVAALGPKMLEVTGRLADGTATWTTGAKTLRDHIVPSITGAAEKAGRPAPRVIAGLPVCVTDDAAAARERAARELVVYGQLPAYRAMLDREGAATPGDIAVVGDEATVTAAIAELGEGGVTEFNAAIFGSDDEQARTRKLLAGLATA